MKIRHTIWAAAGLVALSIGGAALLLRPGAPQVSAADQLRQEKEAHQRTAIVGGAVAATSAFQAWRAARRERAERERP